MSIDLFYSALAVGIGFLALLLQLARRRQRSPCWYYSFLGTQAKKTWRIRCAAVPRYLYLASLFLMLLSLTDMRLWRDQQITIPAGNAAGAIPREGIAIYFILDQSLSMDEQVTMPDVKGAIRRLKKRDLLKEVTLEFINGSPQSGLPGRHSDMLGAVGFSRGAQVLVPLTLEHQELEKVLSQLDTMKIKDQDGTAIGYAIFKTANLITAACNFVEERRRQGKPAYDIKNTVMILITDGLPETNPLDKGNALRNISVEDAAAFAAANKIRLYIINVEPKLSQEQFGPHRRMMQKAASSTGGQFFMAGQDKSLVSIYKEIDHLEKSSLPTPAATVKQQEQKVTVTSFYLYPWTLAGAVLFLLLAWILEMTALRSIP